MIIWHLERLKDLRKWLSAQDGHTYTLEEMSALIGIARSTLQRWEAGGTEDPDVGKVAKAVEIFNDRLNGVTVRIDDLYEVENDFGARPFGGTPKNKTWATSAFEIAQA